VEAPALPRNEAQRLATLRPVCLLTDNTAREASIETLMTQSSAIRFELDLLGSRLPQSAGYGELIEALAHDLGRCLRGGLN